MDGIKIIGSTLWSKISLENKKYMESCINDYNLIKKINVENKLISINIDDTNKWNDDCIKFIINELNCDIPCILLTHHAPLFSDNKLDIIRQIQNIYSLNNEAFHNNLDLIKKPLVAWIYGHTHYVNKFIYNNVLLLTNQLGYSSESTQKTFNPYAYIDLDKIKK